MCVCVSLAVFTLPADVCVCVFLWDISASIFLNVCVRVFINPLEQTCALVDLLPKRAKQGAFNPGVNGALSPHSHRTLPSDPRAANVSF